MLSYLASPTSSLGTRPLRLLSLSLACQVVRYTPPHKTNNIFCKPFLSMFIRVHLWLPFSYQSNSPIVIRAGAHENPKKDKNKDQVDKQTQTLVRSRHQDQPRPRAGRRRLYMEGSHAQRSLLVPLRRKSKARKAAPFQSAMSMLNFYINRAGKNMTSERKAILNQAKEELRKIYKRK